MIVKLLTEHHLEFLSLKRGCTGSSEPTNVKMPHCWKSHALAHFLFLSLFFFLLFFHFYTPPLKCGGVLCYTFGCLSVRPCSPFPIDNLSIYSRYFFKFCIHIVIGDEWYGIVNGQNLSIFNSYCPFSYWKNGFWPVIPLLFMIS